MRIHSNTKLVALSFAMLALGGLGCGSGSSATDGTGNDGSLPASTVPGVLWNGLAEPLVLQFDNESIYWGSRGTVEEGYEGVWSTPKTNPQQATHLVQQVEVNSLAQFGNELLYLDSASGYPSRVSKQGGTPVHAGSSIFEPLASDGERAYMVDDCVITAYEPGATSAVVVAESCARSLTVGGDYLYFETDYDKTTDTASLGRVSKTGGTIEILTKLPGTINELTVGSKFATIVLWHSDLTLSLVQVSLVDRTLTQIPTTDEVSSLSKLASAGDKSYFLNDFATKSTVSRIEDGQLVPHASFSKEVGFVHLITVDKDALYWSANANVEFGEGYFLGKTAL